MKSLLVLMLMIVGSEALPADAMLDAVKSLEGEWQTADGGLSVDYRVVSNGTAVMETIDSGTKEEMVTVYYQAGDGLMLTHFCPLNNQPRMKTTVESTVQRLVFSLVDITHLASPEAGHMSKLVLSLPDSDHVTHEWTFSEGGKEQKHTFSLARKKQAALSGGDTDCTIQPLQSYERHNPGNLRLAVYSRHEADEHDCRWDARRKQEHEPPKCTCARCSCR